MGTSNSFPGQGNNTPLVPDWLEPDSLPLPGMPNGHPQPPPVPTDGVPDAYPISPTSEPRPNIEIPPASPPTISPLPNRFQTARTNLSQFASAGGGAGSSLRRGLSNYVSKSSGGSRQATRRMGSSRKAGGKLLGFMRDAIERGVEAALEALNLETLAGRSINEIFLGMIDFVCPDGGNVDQGIARGSYIETIADLAVNGITDLSTLSPAQMQTVFELYTTHTIKNRIYNDVGTKMIQFPKDAKIALQIQKQVFDFIRRSVSDALSITKDRMISLTQSNIQKFVDQIYLSAFELLRNLGSIETETL